MVTALYRRYRPENFAEMIGQSQVTDPLMTALRTDRVNHAYLFSGPRGCGKTTSARILARCLNCAEGLTDQPCGVCPSCIELSRAGGGSLDVVEIDAASHGGVDDARDLRERAIFAPARDRFKIFIIDEAHMVTSGGFNALLKIVEEPPEHVKFIFATTEPEKVLGTIRSRTHHYPFRLIPPAPMLEYVQKLCDEEGVKVAPGVLPLVVRAGGGSPRDTLSLLDQLIAGSEGDTVDYERAVALLGYTHGALLDEVVEAIGMRDAAGAFAAVDRVVQTGQDPRRFVEDLLERLRDLIIVAASNPETARTVLRGIPDDDLARMDVQASKLGAAELSRIADIVNTALTDMTGATSPRLHLELMIARALVPAGPAVAAAPAAPAADRVAVREHVTPPQASARPGATEERAVPAGRGATEERLETPLPAGPVTFPQVRDAWPEVLAVVQNAKRSAWMVLFASQPRELREGDVLVLGFANQSDVEGLKQPAPPGQGVGDLLKRAIKQVLGIDAKLIARVDGPTDASEALTSETPGGGDAPAAAASSAVAEAAGSPAATSPATAPPATAPLAATSSAAPSAPAATAAASSVPVPPAEALPASVDSWATVAIPGADDLPAPSDDDAPPPDDAPPADMTPRAAEFTPVRSDAPPPTTPPSGASQPSAAPAGTRPSAPSRAPARPPAEAEGSRAPAGVQRYGEAVVREVLGATFIEEQPHSAPGRSGFGE